MSAISPEPGVLANLDVLEAFMEFPAPLALLDEEGKAELVNARFLACFSDGELDSVALQAMARNPDGAWRAVRLFEGEGTKREVRVRAVRTTRRVLLIVEETEGVAHGTPLDALHARIAELENLAATDHLTGAWNRAHLDRVIETELERSCASRQPLTLILFDIDHFKRINDRFGHAAGDSVLVELVQLVRSRTRASDLLFRWGGEEFVVLAAGAGYRRAERIAEGLRKAVEENDFEGVGRVTVSFGVAEHTGEEGAQDWFLRLDAALYEAKESGRNRVVVARSGNSDAWAAEGGGSALHLNWQEGYECGDATIDAEHRELFRLANRLIDASVDERATPPGPLLDELLAHVVRHFADEEAILERLNYDHLVEHRRAHAGLIKRALALKARVDAGKAHLGAVVEFLAQDVVARHLIAADRAFFPLFSKPA